MGDPPVLILLNPKHGRVARATSFHSAPLDQSAGMPPMSTTFDALAFERGTDPLLRFLTLETARALVAFRGDVALRQRIEDLAQRNTEWDLTEAERLEYEGYVRGNYFVAVVQAKARKLLAPRQRRAIAAPTPRRPPQ